MEVPKRESSIESFAIPSFRVFVIQFKEIAKARKNENPKSEIRRGAELTKRMSESST